MERKIFRLFSIILLIALTGCYTTNKAKKQIAKAQALKPNEMAIACDLFYPTKDSVVEVTKILTGKNDTLTYTINDTIINNDTMYIYLDRTKYINRTDTIKHTVVRTQESKAKDLIISKLKQDNTKTEANYQNIKSNRNSWRLWFFVLVAIYLGKIFVTKRLF